MMNQEYKEKWVAALRSGDYEQCKGRLRTDKDDATKAYCCLGVLSDVVAKENPKYIWQNNVVMTPTGSYGSTALAKHMAVYLNMDTDPLVEYLAAPDNRASLSALNDTYNLNFNQIADIIEAQL
jgi:hypothetical protein